MKELIVRIPHLLVLVGDIDKAKKQLEEIPDNLGISLFYFYIDKFLPEVEKNPNMSFEKNTSLHRLSAFAEDKVRDKELNDPRRYIQPTISSILKSKVGVEETKKFCQFSNKYNLGDQDPVIR